MKMPRGGTLNTLEKGETANPNGRPRKYVSQLKEMGYKLSEINDCIMTMVAMTMDELAEVFKNENATILEKTIAKALKTSLDKGTLESVETLISRVHGRPKESVAIDGSLLDIKKITIEIINGEGNPPPLIGG